MALTPEWRKRIEKWIGELKNRTYMPLGALCFDAAFTYEHLSVVQACRLSYDTVAPQARWGRKWEYGWFRAKVIIPEDGEGKRIVIVPDTGGESLVFINGMPAGMIGWAHKEITLSRRARAGELYDILLESYAGHGPVAVDSLPKPPEKSRDNSNEDECQQVYRGGSFGVWEDEMFQLGIETNMLLRLRDALEPNSLRVAEIDAGLREFTVVVDFEQSHCELMASVVEARRRLKRLFECVNGTATPRMYAFGHAHLDVAWLWPWAETRRKAARTLSTQLALCEEYPDYRFVHSQMRLFHFVKEDYPELYARVKDAIARGVIVPEGGMWVEADTNIPSGESLIRQFVHGKRFAQDEFGYDCRLLWLPDVFGYSAALPQIMRGCGISYFATAKIFWNYHGGESFPYNTFWWEGIDGTRVLADLFVDYNAQVWPDSVIDKWNNRVQKDGISARIMPFGWGDGGGGPTREHLECLRRMDNLEGVPRVHMASPVDYFVDLEQRGVDTVYVGELYYQAHRGTYTSQSTAKRLNRLAETSLREAEMWGAVSRRLGCSSFCQTDLDKAWKLVLGNQFHDILPGSSIQRVYRDAAAAYEEAITIARQSTNFSISSLTDKNDESLVIFNSLSFPRSVLVSLPFLAEAVVSQFGEVLEVQRVGETVWAEVSVPPCGWTTIRRSCARQKDPSHIVEASNDCLENELIRVLFDKSGAIRSIFDKTAQYEWAAGACNELRMYKDVPASFDAWDIDSSYEACRIPLDTMPEIETVSSGPLFGSVRIRYSINRSILEQTICLRRGKRRLDFSTTVYWKECHKLLKVAFPITILSNEAIHEIQFGHLRRPNHRSRPFDRDRFEVCHQRWTALCEEGRGAAVLSDGKYGVNVLGNTINLTLLRAPKAPDPEADIGTHSFTYSLYLWNGSFFECDVVREAYDLCAPLSFTAGSAAQRSLFSVDAPNVFIDTVKLAEDGSGDLVMRLYEAKRTYTRCSITLGLPLQRAQCATMLEERGNLIPITSGKLQLEFRPFEIKTLRFS